MNEEATLYQNECAKQVYNLISEGKKRITLLMPTGTGKMFVCLLIADKLAEENYKTVIVSDMGMIAYQTQGLIEDKCKNKIESTFLENFLLEKKEADLVILYCLKASSRLKMQKYADENPDTIILSTGDPIFSDELIMTGTLDYYYNQIKYDPTKKNESLGELALLYKNLGNVKPFFFYTESMIDVRDIISADLSEISEVQEQIKKDKYVISRELSILSKDPALTSYPEMVSIFQKMRRKLQYCEQLLICCGIPQDTIDEEFEELEYLREQMKGILFNADGSVNDDAVSEFQASVAKSILRVSKSALTLEAYDRYQDLLVDKLTEEIWEKKLCKESKDYLITAKMTFESMNKMERKAELDYGGICLLVSKALDNELTRRFYSEYAEYLRNKYPLPIQINKWPDGMLRRDKRDILDEKDFTLGTVPFVVGIDKFGKIKNPYDNKCFLEYAKKELYKSDLSVSEVAKRIKNIINYVDKVRVDYRNPCAHRNAIDYVTAEECMAYLVEIYMKLKEILEDMKW